MRHLICIMFALVFLQTVSIAKGDVVIKRTTLKDIPGCILGKPIKYKEEGAFVRVCIDNKRYVIRNISSAFGYDELDIEQQFPDRARQTKCTCPKEEIQDLRVGDRVNIVVYSPDKDEMRYVNDVYYVNNNTRVTANRVSYTNAKGDKLVYVNKRIKKRR